MKFVLSVLQHGATTGHAVRIVGEFEQLDDAVVAAKQVVDDMLGKLHAPVMTSAQLFAKYREAAETPIISRDDEETMKASSFNHIQHAKMRCDELCGT